MQQGRTRKIVITSGYFNPLHIGHINLIREAKNLGDYLIVIVNNDEQVKIKGSFPFMVQEERIEIIKALRYADEVILSVDKDGFQAESLRSIVQKHSGEFIFAKGGDRHPGNLPECELNVCRDFNIKIVSGVGGDKVQSSSSLINHLRHGS